MPHLCTSTILRLVLVVSGLVSMVTAQSQWRLWAPGKVADTGIYHVQLAQISSPLQGTGIMAITTSGELLIMGASPGAHPPVPPPSTTYVRVVGGAKPIAELSNWQLVQWPLFGIGITPSGSLYPQRLAASLAADAPRSASHRPACAVSCATRCLEPRTIYP